MTVTSNQESIQDIKRVMEIFKTSECAIRPHFILTGPSGSSKTHTIAHLAEELGLSMVEVNAAQLTKEGTSGNSLSKALSPLLQQGGNPVICFVDEFDKLFISGNSNSSLAHETTNGVQNEFLRVLEGIKTSVYGDFGKYVEAACDNVLFVFAGAFNGEEDINLDRLREFGIKTEFLGRVGLTFAMSKLTLKDLESILKESTLLSDYLTLFPDAKRPVAMKAIMDAVEENFEKNTIGVRLLSTLTHQYFIHGSLKKSTVRKSSFQKTLSLA